MEALMSAKKKLKNSVEKLSSKITNKIIKMESSFNEQAISIHLNIINRLNDLHQKIIFSTESIQQINSIIKEQNLDINNDEDVVKLYRSLLYLMENPVSAGKRIRKKTRKRRRKRTQRRRR